MLARHPFFVSVLYLSSPVPFLRYQHANPDDNAGLLIPVRLVWGKSIVPDGAIGNPYLLLGEMVVYRSNGAEIVVVLTPLQMDNLSFLLCHSIVFPSKVEKDDKYSKKVIFFYSIYCIY